MRFIFRGRRSTERLLWCPWGSVFPNDSVSCRLLIACCFAHGQELVRDFHASAVICSRHCLLVSSWPYRVRWFVKVCIQNLGSACFMGWMWQYMAMQGLKNISRYIFCLHTCAQRICKFIFCCNLIVSKLSGCNKNLKTKVPATFVVLTVFRLVLELIQPQFPWNMCLRLLNWPMLKPSPLSPWNFLLSCFSPWNFVRSCKLKNSSNNK